MMSCKEVLDALSSYIDEDLRKEVAAQMNKHIGLCSHCRAELDTITMTIRLYRHEPVPEVPADCHERLVKILEIEKMKRRQDPTSSGA